MNNVFAVNLSLALGISIDYAVHIAHRYLVVVPPDHLISNKERRDFKVAKAISQMGSSVFHGGFSTILCVLVLGWAKSYIFTVFFRTWLPMMGFGMLNGFILQPVILSYIGPVDSGFTRVEKDNKIQDSDENKKVDEVEFSDTIKEGVPVVIVDHIGDVVAP